MPEHTTSISRSSPNLQLQIKPYNYSACPRHGHEDWAKQATELMAVEQRDKG